MPPDALTFLRALHPTAVGFCELRVLPSKRQQFLSCAAAWDADVLRTLEALSAGENVYCGVATRRTAANGTAENCSELHVVWTDVDFKDTPEADARPRLATFPIPPHMIVRTGGGLHAYWRLRAPLHLPADTGTATTVLTQLADYFNGDRSAAEIARVLRIPTTRNHKYSPARDVVLEHLEDGTVDVSELLDYLPAPERKPNGGSAREAPFSVPPKLRAGERNTLLYKAARSMHAKGFSAAEIQAALTVMNLERCDPPLDQAEVDQIAQHAADQADRPDFVGDEPPAEEAPFAETFPVFCARLQTHQAPTDLIPGWVPGAGIELLHGAPRTHKTWTLMELARACATGTPAFGLPALVAPAPLAVWYLTEEDPELSVRDRFLCLLAGRGGATRPETLHISSQRGISFDDPTWQRHVVTYARDTHIRVVILDPIRASSLAVDQGPRELAPLVRFLRHLIHATGCTLVLGHHDVKPAVGKPDDRPRPLRASGGGIFSIATNPIHAELVDPDKLQALLTPGYFKFAIAPDPLLVTLESDHPQHPTWVRVTGEPTTATTAASVTLQHRIRAYLAEHPGTSGSALAKALGRRKGDTLAMLERMCHANEVDSFEHGRATLWKLRTP